MEKDFKNLYGEWALLTGGSSGIGKALAHEIAAKGLNLLLVARGTTELNNVATEIQEQYHVSVCVLIADLSVKEDINALINKTGQFEIGLLVLSAGMENNGSFILNELDKELSVIQLNIVSTMTLTHHFVKKMEKRRRGGVLFISSLMGHMPSPYFSNYAATKSYVLNFGASLYGELKSKGIAVSVLSPGVTQTPMSENIGIDWSKTKVQVMSPQLVASEAIRYFGKKFSIIPGRGNKIVAFIAKGILSYSKLALANQRMMQQILDPIKL